MNIFKSNLNLEKKNSWKKLILLQILNFEE